MGNLLRFSLVLLKLKPLLVTVVLCLFLTACNSELADLSPIKNAPFKLEARNLESFTTLFIYMTNTDGKEAFAKKFTSVPVIKMEVPQGDYHFYGISYNGTNVSQCAIVTNKSIRNTENPVILEFSSTTCADEIFIGPDDSLNSGTVTAPAFAFTTLEFCEELAGITSIAHKCTDDMSDPDRREARGHAFSFRWILQGFQKKSGKVALTGDEWKSTCIDSVGNTLSGYSPSPLGNTLPAGDGLITPFFIRLELWPGGTGCSTGNPVYVDLPKGLLSQTPKSKYFTSGVTHKLYVKINGDDICRGENLTGAFAGGNGNIGAPKLICNADQLYNMLPDSTNPADYSAAINRYYKLLANIDLTNYPVKGNGLAKSWADCVEDGSNFLPLGTTYDGSSCSYVNMTRLFDGGDKTIKGLKIKSSLPETGFFRSISGATIQRLKFESPEIQGTRYVGTVAGYATQANYQGITIKNAKVYGSENYIGGLFGFQSEGKAQGIVIRNVTVTGNDYVGGLGGRMESGALANIRRSYVDGSITGNMFVGGITGSFGNAGVPSLASVVRFRGDITSSGSYIGGLFGVAHSSKLLHTYVQVDVNLMWPGPYIYLGGLIGKYESNLGGGDSGIEGSYAQGSLSHKCSALNTSCSIGTVVGGTDGTYSLVDFLSVVYPYNSYITGIGPEFGSPQANASFQSLNPNWENSGGDSLMDAFPSTIWEFSTSDYPRFVNEAK